MSVILLPIPCILNANMKKIHSIVYVSSAVNELTEEELLSLLMDSRERNRRTEVTGVLLYSHCRFVQCIEGPTDAIDELFASIRADRRHKNVIQLVNEYIERRDFASWTMGHSRLNAQNFDHLLEASSPLCNTRAFPASGSNGKQLLQIAWEQILLDARKSNLR